MLKPQWLIMVGGGDFVLLLFLRAPGGAACGFSSWIIFGGWRFEFVCLCCLSECWIVVLFTTSLHECQLFSSILILLPTSS
jgi:hypothetical protein